MRAKSESWNSATDDRREWPKEFDAAIAQNSEMLRKEGHVITRIRLALDDLKKVAHRRNKPAKHVLAVPRLVRSDGGTIAEDFARRRSSPEYEFTKHKLFEMPAPFCALSHMQLAAIHHRQVTPQLCK